MKKLLILAIAGIFYFGVNAQTQKTTRDTSTKKKNTRITGQDSVSKHNEEKHQNRKREHKKNIYEDKKSDEK